LKIGYIGSLHFSCYYLQYVPRLNLSTAPDLHFYKPYDCTALDVITGTFKASWFCRILDRFTRRAKPIRISGVLPYLLLFHCNNSYANAPQRYVIRTLQPVLFNVFANNMRTYVYRFSYVRAVCDRNERCESLLHFGCTIFIQPFSPCLQIYNLLYLPSLFPMSLVRGNTARMFTQDYPAQATTGSHI